MTSSNNAETSKWKNFITLKSDKAHKKIIYNISSYNNKIIGTKTKFLILDILDLQTEGWGNKDQDNLRKKDNLHK